MLPFDFLLRSGPPRVVVAAGKDAYGNAREALAAFDLSRVRGLRVLLKPNAGRIAPAGTGIVTDPGAVAAAIEVFRAAGAEVSVAESPISGVKTFEAFEASGIAAVARERDCPLIDLDERPPVPVDIPGALAIRRLQVCAAVLEADLIVSLPVLKTHMHTGVSLAVKNMKGCLWRRSKVGFHMLPPVPGREEKPLDLAIADLATALRPHFSLADGSVGMEGLGPSAGSPRPAGLAVAGADPFAVDAVCCRLMGIDPSDIVHLREGAARCGAALETDRFEIVPGDWARLAVPFAPPPRELALGMPGVRVLDRNSCSACQSSLLLFLKRYGERILDYFPGASEAVFAIGKGHAELPGGCVCVGNCTMRHHGIGPFVPGCPPVVSEILTAVTGKPCVDTEDGEGRG